MAHLAFIFCCFIWGSSFILVDRVAHVMGPVEIALWRFGGGSAVLGMLWWLTQRNYRLTRAEFFKIAAIALAFNAPPQIILPYLINQGFGHSFFGPMVAPVPLITILVSIPLLGIRPTARQLFGVIGGLSCLWLIVDDGFDRGMSFAFIALALTIPVMSALSNTAIKWQLPQVPALPLTMVMLMMAGISLAPLEFSQGAQDALHLVSPTEQPTFESWGYMALLAVVATGFSTAAFVWMIKVRGPLFAGMATYVVPVISLLWGALDGEKISMQQVGAIVGVLTMVALVQLESRREVPVAEPIIPSMPLDVADAVTAFPLMVEASATPTSQVA